MDPPPTVPSMENYIKSANPPKRKPSIYVELPANTKRRRGAFNAGTTEGASKHADKGVQSEQEIEWQAKEIEWRKREADWRKKEADWRKKEADWRAREANWCAIAQKQEEVMASLLTCEKRMMKQIVATKERADHLLDDRKSLQLNPQRTALLHLEENYICPICSEIIAAPYTVGVATCGHTFCGICLLKWFLTVMHDCGTWHCAVKCPMCRSSLHEVPAYEHGQPRSLCYISFTPNHLVHGAILDLLRVLDKPLDQGQALAETSAAPAAEPKRRKRARNGAAEAATLYTEPRIADWAACGFHRMGWDARDATGEAEMKHLRDVWPRLTPDGFLALKERIMAL